MLAFNALRRAFDFRGRSSRAEYWQFVGCAALAGIATMTFDATVFGWYGTPVLSLLLLTVLLIPAYSVTMRRLHDRDHSAWIIVVVWGLNFLGTFLMKFYNQNQFTAIGPSARFAWFAITGLQLGMACYMLFQLAQAGAEDDNRFGPPPSDEPIEGGITFSEAGGLAKGVIAKVSGQDPLAQIERLAKLRDDGVLTGEEFDAQKASLLKRL